MKRLFTAILIAFSTVAVAQNFPYTFSVHQEPYQDLGSSKNLYSDYPWTTTFSRPPIPLNFDFYSDTAKWNLLSVWNNMEELRVVSDANTYQFVLLTGAFQDRGVGMAPPGKSHIEWEMMGMTGNRILKLQFNNVGFKKERDVYSTNKDSINLQIWLYEDTHVVELRYGPRNVSHMTDYFGASGPVIGFRRIIDNNNPAYNWYFYLQGDATNPTLDSVANDGPVNSGLNALPPDGTVYRFTPINTNTVTGTEALASRVYPTLASSQVVVEVTESTTYRLISITGQVVSNGVLNAGKNLINVEHIPAGNYFLQMQQDQKHSTVKIFKL